VSRKANPVTNQRTLKESRKMSDDDSDSGKSRSREVSTEAGPPPLLALMWQTFRERQAALASVCPESYSGPPLNRKRRPSSVLPPGVQPRRSMRVSRELEGLTRFNDTSKPSFREPKAARREGSRVGLGSQAGKRSRPDDESSQTQVSNRSRVT
jgi:hypothetical protein